MLLLKEKHKLHIYIKGNNKDSIGIHNNVINKGGDSFSEVRGGDVNVHDNAQNPYYNPA